MNKNNPLHYYNPMHWSSYDIAHFLITASVMGIVLWSVIILAGCAQLREYDYNSKPMFDTLERNKY